MERAFGTNLTRDKEFNLVAKHHHLYNFKGWPPFMEIDNTTLQDLAIINGADDFSVFNKIDFCKTAGGRSRLLAMLQQPLDSIAAIEGIQQTLQLILQKEQHWPQQISNGSVMVIQKFYQTVVADIPEHPSPFTAFIFTIWHKADYSLIKYSTGHCFDFIKGMQNLLQHFNNADTPAPFKKICQQIEQLINKDELVIIAQRPRIADLQVTEQLQLAHYLKYQFKEQLLTLIDHYAQLDAWYSMAMAVKQHGLQFPRFVSSNQPLLKAEGLYHLLLENAVKYDVTLTPDRNFLFLTGANMAGKSTFIKAVGVAVFLAHIGMGVPGHQLELSLVDGLLSNINITDNLGKGESYFFNEVQRIKSTVTKISDGRNWLILIDELFKGTNVEDAMKCSATVIEGFLKLHNTLFILSTHLYEIGATLKQHANISFNYFETTIKEGELIFSYQLKAGISNDRLGYLILKKEGVVDLLEQL